MDILSGKFVINRNEEAVIVSEVVRDVQFVVLYFSASWCPPCQTFLPRLKELYEEAKKRDVNLEIIFVPSDHDNDEMLRYFATTHGPWFTLSVGPLAHAMRNKFHVVSIPNLIILSKDGKIVTKNAHRDLETLEDPLKAWFPEYATDLANNE